MLTYGSFKIKNGNILSTFLCVTQWLRAQTLEPDPSFSADELCDLGQVTTDEKRGSTETKLTVI